MRIHLHVSCAGFAIDKTKTEINALDGVRVYEILEDYAKHNNADIILKQIDEFVIFNNGSPVKLDAMLNDGDKLDVMRILSGG